MKAFARAWRGAVEAPRESEARAALVGFLREAPPLEAAWGVWLLAGGRWGRSVPAADLRRWAGEEAGIPEWLLGAAHRAVGNLPEALAHLFGEPERPRDWPLHQLVAERLEPLSRARRDVRRELVVATWQELTGYERDVYNRLLAGSLRPRPRVGTLASAVAEVHGGDAAAIAERLAGDWTPGARALERLARDHGATAKARPGALFAAGEGTEEGRDEAGGPRGAEVRFDAVLLYAQRSDGGRGNLYTELTLGAWHEGALVPVAKTAGGLADGEALELDRWVRRNIVDRFGPVRHVKAELVFTVACAAVLPSARHKAGLTLREPRLVEWRRGQDPGGAAQLLALRALAGSAAPAGPAERAAGGAHDAPGAHDAYGPDDAPG